MEARAGFASGQLADNSVVRGAVIAFDEHCQTHVHCLLFWEATPVFLIALTSCCSLSSYGNIHDKPSLKLPATPDIERFPG